MLKTGYNFIKMSHRILITVIAVSICLSCFAVYLSAQDKKDDKMLEISVYLGAGGHGTESGYGSTFDVLGFGGGLEYFLTTRISIEGQINYLPNIAYALGSPGGRRPWGEADVNCIGQDEKYRLLWDINLLFYTLPTVGKRPMRLFITVGIGYHYDRGEGTYISIETQEQFKDGYGSFWFQGINFGGGFKVNIKDNWALRLLYKIHRLGGEEGQTNRLALGLSYRF